MAKLTRHLKTYSDEIKLRIYKKLSEHGHRFTELSVACKINQVTLSEYLLHAQEMSEVERDPRSKQYNLTPKGQENLQRILNAEAAKDHPIMFQGRLDSEGDLVPSDLRSDGQSFFGVIRFARARGEVPGGQVGPSSLSRDACAVRQRGVARWFVHVPFLG